VVWVGDIDDQRLDPRRTDGVGVPVASNTREEIPCPGQRLENAFYLPKCLYSLLLILSGLKSFRVQDVSTEVSTETL